MDEPSSSNAATQAVPTSLVGGPQEIVHFVVQSDYNSGAAFLPGLNNLLHKDHLALGQGWLSITAPFKAPHTATRVVQRRTVELQHAVHDGEPTAARFAVVMA
eukprot:365707-Chlamydomonas_euryale.AAC.11